MMENTKATHHHYGTRNNKIPKIDTHENDGMYESRKPSGLIKTVYTTKNGGSPSSPAVRANKLCLFSGYASPPCRPIISSSQANDNEIEWDLTSPSARRYQTLMSDKKTSTPNRTPTRGELPMKRELPRPRLALCKKNIALSSSEDNGLDLMDELAALDNLVNSEQAKQGQGVMTPPLSVKGNTDNSGNSSPAFVRIKNSEACAQKGDVDTSDAFGDDSFFSESMLLSTQALEKEAVDPGLLNHSSPALRKRSSPSVPSSPESLVQMNPIRKSFDIETNNDDETGTEISTRSRSSNTTSTQISSTAHSVRRDEKVMPSPIPKKKPDTFLPPNKIPYRPNAKQNSTPKRSCSIVESKLLKPIPPPSANRQAVSPRLGTLPPICIGVKRLPEEPLTAPVIPACNPPKVSNLFDDGDDDFLFAIAEQVESQYIQKKPPKRESEFNDDDIFFQPEVLEFISQIERSQSVPAKPKSTAELLEEKRQAAIRRREQRMMNRR